MKPDTSKNPQIAALNTKIERARAELAREDTLVSTAAATRESAAAATREAASAYAEAPSPALLAAHRTAKEAERGAVATHDQATAKRGALAGRVEELEQERRRILDAEAAEAARQKAAGVAEAAQAQRLHATKADRDYLAGLSARIGRAAFMTSIEPSLAKLVQARRDIEAALAEIRAARDAQTARHVEAVTLLAEIGEPAPPAPPAPVGEPAERIALVLARQALGEAYEGELGEDVARWIDLPRFTGPTRDADFARWAFAALGFDFGAGSRRHVEPIRALDLLLMHGRDIGREADDKGRLAEQLKELASVTDAYADPVLKARGAVHELARSLSDAHESGRNPRRLAREQHLGELVRRGAHALACWNASEAAKHCAGVYKVPGERGQVQLLHAAPDGLGKTPDSLAYALGIRDLPEHVAVRAFLGIAGRKKLADLINPIPAAPSPAAPLAAVAEPPAFA